MNDCMNATSICSIPNKDKSLKISDFEPMVHVTSFKEPSLGLTHFWTLPPPRGDGGIHKHKQGVIFISDFWVVRKVFLQFCFAKEEFWE